MKTRIKEPEIDGLSFRHVAQIIRRKMITKVYADKTAYNKKDKSWKSEIQKTQSM